MRKIFSTITLLVLLLASCQKSQDQNPCKNKVLRIAFMHMPFNVDPRRTGEPVSSTMVFMTFEGLMHLESDGSISKALAQSIDISDDQKTYTFHLKEAKWTDGMPITAYDFEYSWKTMLDPNFPSVCPYLFYSIQGAEKAKKGEISTEEVGIKALDERTLQVKLQNPTPYFLDLTGFCAFFPVPKHIDQANPNWFKNPGPEMVCSGPFKIHKWQHGDEIKVVRNADFWEAETVILNGIHISIINEQATTLQMFEQGKIDWVGNLLTPLSLDALSSLHKAGKIQSFPAGNTIFVSYNVHSKPFDNLNIRKAFSTAIDRKAITDHITQLSELPATQVIPPVLTKNKILDLIPTKPKIEEAQNLFQQGLSEMGITAAEIPPIKLMFPADEVYKRVGESLQQQWSQAFGIQIESDYCEMKVFFDRLQLRDYQLAEAVWWAQYADPMNILERFRYGNGNKNYPGWENETYLSLIDQVETAKDPVVRLELIRAAEKVIVDQVPLAPVYHFNSNCLSQPYVAGVEISPISHMQFRRTYFIDDES